MKPLSRFPVLEVTKIKRVHLTNIQKDQVVTQFIEMVREGASRLNASQALGQPMSFFYRMFKEKGITLDKYPHKELTDEEKNKILHLFTDLRYEIKTIGKELKRNYTTISKFLNEQGISPIRENLIQKYKSQEDIVEMAISGSTQKEISIASGYSIAQISRVVKDKTGLGMSERAEDRRRAVRFRLKERMSIDEIIDIFYGKYARSTIFQWIKPFPLTPAELQKRHSKNKKSKPQDENNNPEPQKQKSIISKIASTKNLSRKQKGSISEYAIFMRLQAIGIDVFIPTTQTVFDYVAYNARNDKFIKIQIKTVQTGGKVSLMCTGPRIDGRSTQRGYKKGEFDYIIGYDIDHDDAYVFSWDETEGYVNGVSINVDFLERWDKILGGSLKEPPKNN